MKAVHSQEMKNMMERVQFAEEREKKARATKEQLIEIIRTFEGDDKSKFTSDLTALKDFYEQMLQDLKSEFEDDISQYKERIVDLEARLQRGCQKDCGKQTNLEQTDITVIGELRERISCLEHENLQLKMKEERRQKQVEEDSQEEDKIRENQNLLKEEHKQIMKTMQSEYSENIMKIISNYENKLLDLRMQTNRQSQIECSKCVARKLRNSSSYNSPSKYSQVHEESRSEFQREDSVNQQRLHNDYQPMRSSIQRGEKRMAESVSYPVLRANPVHSSIKRDIRPSNGLAADHNFLTVPKVNNFTLALSGQSRENEGDQHETSAEYNPMPFTQEALYENSKNKYIIGSIGKPAGREQSLGRRVNDTLGKSMVKYIDSDAKDIDAVNDRVLKDIRNVDCFAKRVSRDDDAGHSEQAKKQFNRQEYGNNQSEFLRRLKAIAPSERDYTQRSTGAKFTQESEDEQAYLHRQIIDLLSKAEQSRASGRSRQVDRSQRLSPPPRSDLNESRWGANDRGFLNFYRENWHSSAFTLEDD